MRDGGYRPDFLDPPPRGPDTTIEDGLDALATADTALVQDELADALAGADSQLRRRVLSDVERTRGACSLAIRQVWTTLLAPDWPARRSVLESDLLHRGPA